MTNTLRCSACGKERDSSLSGDMCLDCISLSNYEDSDSDGGEIIPYEDVSDEEIADLFEGW